MTAPSSLSCARHATARARSSRRSTSRRCRASATRLGVPTAGVWREILNSDAALYGGSGVGNYGVAETSAVPSHGRGQSLLLMLPPLGALFLRCETA